jgi:hypothetical protein
MSVTTQVLNNADAKKLKKLLANANRTDRAKLEKKLAAIVRNAVAGSTDPALQAKIAGDAISKIPL